MGVVTKTGGCIYCGQIGTVEVEDNTPDEVVDKEVTINCSCTSAKVARDRKKKQAKAQENVEELFANHSEDVREFLKAAVVLIGENMVDKISVDTGRKVKAQITKTSKGNIKVERTETRKMAVEN